MTLACTAPTVGPVQTSLSVEQTGQLLRLDRSELLALVTQRRLRTVPTPEGHQVARCSLVAELARRLPDDAQARCRDLPACVLLIDDDKVAVTYYMRLVRHVLPRSLVFSAGTHAEAVHLLGQVRPDLVLTDLSMPIDGWRLAWWLHVSPLHARVLTAAVTGLTPAEAQRAGGLPPSVQLLLKGQGPEPVVHWLQAAALVGLDAAGTAARPAAWPQWPADSGQHAPFARDPGGVGTVGRPQ